MARAYDVLWRKPQNIRISLPRAVPSVSSKGFAIIKDDLGNSISEANSYLRVLEALNPTSLLVSAFDLFHGLVRDLDSAMKTPEFAIIDSGGYELNTDWDSTEVKRPPYQPPNDFSREDYVGLLRTLDTDWPLVITNFDHNQVGRPLRDQVADARDLFETFRSFMSNFIIKPTEGTVIDVNSVAGSIQSMQSFDVIGVTEKELGKEFGDRLRNLIKLRELLDQNDIVKPIHVWGGLDPMMSKLYFLCGASLFDGISWVRYRYHDGMAVAPSSHAILDNSILDNQRQLLMNRLGSNISHLTKMTGEMGRYVSTGNLEHLGSRASESLSGKPAIPQVDI